MESLTANQAKTNFGSMLLKAQVEPVQINKNGKPVAVVLSAESYNEIDRAMARSIREISSRIKAGDTSGMVDAETFINDLVDGRYD